MQNYKVSVRLPSSCEWPCAWQAMQIKSTVSDESVLRHILCTLAALEVLARPARE